MALPLSGITTSLVGQTLGTSSRDVGSLCKNENINMWSKKKPVILNTPTPDRSGNWWKGSDKNCGIVPKQINSYRDLPDLYANDWKDDNLNGWVYQKPKGGQTEPFRLADFGGYNHYALPPYSNFYVPYNVPKNDYSFVCNCMIPQGGDYQLTLTDVGILENMFFGVFIVRKGLTNGVRATSNNLNSGSVTFKTSGFITGTYTAYPFISSIQYNQDDIEKQGTYYSAPNISPVTFNIIETLTSIIITAEVDDTNKSISYTIKVNNQSGTETFNNNAVRLRYYEKGWDDILVVGEQQQTIPDKTVGSGWTTLATGTFFNVADDLLRHSKVWVSLSYGKYLDYAVPMMKPDIP